MVFMLRDEVILLFSGSLHVLYLGGSIKIVVSFNDCILLIDHCSWWLEYGITSSSLITFVLQFAYDSWLAPLKHVDIERLVDFWTDWFIDVWTDRASGGVIERVRNDWLMEWVIDWLIN